MENNRVSLIHLFLSTAIAILCAPWLWEQPNISIKLIILIQLLAIIVSFFADAPLRNKMIKIYGLNDKNTKKIDSLEGVIPYLKFMFIGTVIIIVTFGSAAIFVDHKNNPDKLIFVVSIITVFLIWLLHNWYAVKIHKTKL
ncbi:MAG: hypothetical protein QM500_01470 [Methylococcales bacterium]